LGLPEAAIRAGIATAAWPGRLQRLEAGPLAARLPAGWELWLDGGHNAGAAAALARVLEGWRDRPIWLVFGMLNTRTPAAFLGPLAPHLAGLATVTIPGEANALPAEALAEAARGLGLDAAPAAGIGPALAAIAAHGGAPARVLLCGSLYLVGAALAENGA
jgi:dihydrofolate synthase/folylpolyglutamate synthase